MTALPVQVWRGQYAVDPLFDCEWLLTRESISDGDDVRAVIVEGCQGRQEIRFERRSQDLLGADKWTQVAMLNDDLRDDDEGNGLTINAEWVGCAVSMMLDLLRLRAGK